MVKNKVKSQAELDWENRTLCSDGSCIGVIGPNGRCKECGQKFKGDLSKVSIPSETAPPPDEPKKAAPEKDPQGSIKPETTKFQRDESWEDRTLCSDGSCIGVIGPDGRCKECGQAFENGK